MQMGEAEAHDGPLGIWSVSTGLSYLGKPRSGLLSENTVKHTFWKPVKGGVELRT